MGKKNPWLDKYKLVDKDQIPSVVAPLDDTWAKALYEMPLGKAGRLPVDDYHTAHNLQRSIAGSVRGSRRSRWGLTMKVRTKVAPEEGKYVLYFWKEEEG